MCLEAYLRQACVIPLERWWIARGADTLAPFRQLALGVCYTRRESRWAGGDGGDGGGEQGAVALFPLERVDILCSAALRGLGQWWRRWRTAGRVRLGDGGGEILAYLALSDPARHGRGHGPGGWLVGVRIGGVQGQ